jgi:hypothetical protein
MHRSIGPSRRAAAVGTAVLIAAVSVAAVAMAAVGATDSKSKKAKVKCPRKVGSGKKVTCKVIGQLPKGPKGPKGAKGSTGAPGAPGAPGSPGLSGYEVVSQTFKEVFIVNSGGQRGLSEVETVSCPSGKQAIGGGSDLGTNESQNGQQRQVTVSLNGPDGAGSGWSVQLFNNSTSIDTSIDLRVYAICATVG